MRMLCDYLRALEAEIPPDSGRHHTFFTDGEINGLVIYTNEDPIVLTLEAEDLAKDRYQFIVDVKNHVREFLNSKEESTCTMKTTQ